MEREDLYRRIVEDIPYNLMIVDKEERIVYCNKSRFLHWDSEALVGLKVGQSFLDDVLKEAMLKCIEEGEKIEDRELEIGDGNHLRYNLDSYYLTKEGEIKFFAFALRETSLSQIRYRENLNARSMRSLILFASGLSHEIKNPLYSLQIHTELLKRQVEAHISERVIKREFLKEIAVVAEELERLDRMSKSILEAFKPMPFKKQAVKLEEILDDVKRLLAPQLKDFRFSIKNLSLEEVPEIWADYDQLKQCFLNLLQNAIDAKDENKEIHKIEVRYRHRRGELKIMIYDNGVGMSKDGLEQIYTPFYTTKMGGNGLGMMVTYKIVRQHGGTLSISSRKGLYTVVCLRFQTGKGVAYIEGDIGWN